MKAKSEKKCVCALEDRVLACENELRDRDHRLTIVETMFKSFDERITEIKEQIKTFTAGMILTTAIGFIGIIVAIAMK